jgi:hypothetical protein
MTAPFSSSRLRELHDRLGSMIDQVGQPDYSLREMVKGLREVRDAMFILSESGERTPWAEWCVRALVALAARNLEETNKTCGKNWPAGQRWGELGHTSQHAFMRKARAECGIPDDAYRAEIETAMVKEGMDLDDVWSAVSGKVAEEGR